FLFFDDRRCLRCQISAHSLKDSLEELKNVLGEKNIGYELKKIKIKNKEEAKKYKFLHSPTIKINNQDIEEIIHGDQFRLRKNYCGSCTAVCGEEIQCRTFHYAGRTFEYIPKSMIREALTKIIK
ncbi:MAG: PadR family transcriptional regulator, partial [uncultured bacterium]